MCIFGLAVLPRIFALPHPFPHLSRDHALIVATNTHKVQMSLEQELGQTKPQLSRVAKSNQLALVNTHMVTPRPGKPRWTVQPQVWGLDRRNHWNTRKPGHTLPWKQLENKTLVEETGTNPAFKTMKKELTADTWATIMSLQVQMFQASFPNRRTSSKPLSPCQQTSCGSRPQTLREYWTETFLPVDRLQGHMVSKCLKPSFASPSDSE